MSAGRGRRPSSRSPPGRRCCCSLRPTWRDRIKPDETPVRNAVSLVSDGSLGELARDSAWSEVDRRASGCSSRSRARSTHEEDTWIGGQVAIGSASPDHQADARCAITTQDPDTGERDLDTLRTILRYRGFRADDDGRKIDFGVPGGRGAGSDLGGRRGPRSSRPTGPAGSHTGRERQTWRTAVPRRISPAFGLGTRAPRALRGGVRPDRCRDVASSGRRRRRSESTRPRRGSAAAREWLAPGGGLRGRRVLHRRRHAGVLQADVADGHVPAEPVPAGSGRGSRPLPVHRRAAVVGLILWDELDDAHLAVLIGRWALYVEGLD